MTIEEITSDWLKICKQYQFCETKVPILRKINIEPKNKNEYKWSVMYFNLSDKYIFDDYKEYAKVLK